MRRIVIIDSVVRGHHSAYMRWIADGAAQRGYDVLLVAPAALEETAHFVDAPKFPHVILPATSHSDARSSVALLAAQFETWSAFRESCRGRIDRDSIVIVPYFDSISYAVPFRGSPFGPASWLALSMRAPTGAIAQTLFGRMKKAAFCFGISRGRGPSALLLIDREAHVELAGKHGFSTRTHYVPDPVEPHRRIDKSEARARLGLPDAALILLVYGAITHRKGIHLLLELLQQDRLPPNIHIAVAGEQDSAVKSTMRQFFLSNPRHGSRLTEIDRYLSKEEEALVFSSADLVWLVYEGHLGMSGVLVRGASYGLPAVVNDQGLMGWYATHRRVALAISPDNPVDSGSRILSDLANDEDLRRDIGRRAQQEFESHTVDHFQNAIFAHVERIAREDPR